MLYPFLHEQLRKDLSVDYLGHEKFFKGDELLGVDEDCHCGGNAVHQHSELTLLETRNISILKNTSLFLLPGFQSYYLGYLVLIVPPIRNLNSTEALDIAGFQVSRTLKGEACPERIGL